MTPSYSELLARARALASPRALSAPRAILGIAGAPGAGKSTLATRLGADLGVPVAAMDGFHLRNAELARRGLRERKGAPETFDAEGYVALLLRLRDGGDVRAPLFDRSIEEPVEDAVLVSGEDPLVITEGNYLLLADDAWSPIRGLLDECWFVEAPEPLRQERLIARHVSFGRSPADAAERVLRGSDADNAELVRATRSRADLIVSLEYP